MFNFVSDLLLKILNPPQDAELMTATPNEEHTSVERNSVYEVLVLLFFDLIHYIKGPILENVIFIIYKWTKHLSLASLSSLV